MTLPSKSPERGTFQTKSYVETVETETDIEKIEEAQAMLDLYASWRDEANARELNPEWQENNMEYDLRISELMLNKVRASDTYAQNLYAALCNNNFQRLDVLPILKGETWSCSWRYAGGIIADMRQEGDYIDWYCSGIGSGLGNGDEDGTKGYVGEGRVTDEIREDLKTLGWIVVADEMDDQ
jgi:hypothetical protein